jgi:PAS domain S-box-containing protein
MYEEKYFHRVPLAEKTNGVFLLDQDGHFVAINTAAEQMSGYSAQELKALTFKELCAPDQLERSVNALEAALKGEACEMETVIIRKDGQRVDLRLTGGLITAYGNASELLVIAGCIPRRERAENELRREREELRAALMMAEYRERERLARVLHDGLQQTLVNMKSQLTAMERGTTDLQSAASEIRGLIDNSIETCRALNADLSPPVLRQGFVPALEWLAGWMHQKLGFTVTVSVSEIPPASQELTTFHFQAVRELLFNVAKRPKVGSARVHVAIREKELQVVVEDDGADFYSDQSRAQPGGAERFGLVTISERISLLGGRFEVNTAPGAGSRFRIIMPFPTTE